MNAPVFMSFIAAAADKDPKVINGRLTKKGSERARMKIASILRIGLNHGHDSIVLSALGCGAYHNPPRHMAELFKEIIELEFADKYKVIMFAIIDDQNSRQSHLSPGNLKCFQEVFKSYCK